MGDGSVHVVENTIHVPEAGMLHLVPENSHTRPAAEDTTVQSQPVQRQRRHPLPPAFGLKFIETVGDESDSAPCKEPRRVGRQSVLVMRTLNI